MRLRLAKAVAVVLIAMALTPASAAANPTPKASLTDIENDVMCVSCREPLAVAQSPQAISERNYIRGLIAQGLTKTQIEQALVTQYGQEVLGKPPAHGFNLTVYILPPAIVVVGIGTLALLLPRWRRRQKASAAARGPISEPSIASADAARLDEELRRYGG
ncbi:MAG: cytochrome c-type biogenesis protein [Solirubrobacteraceae bacterium]